MAGEVEPLDYHVAETRLLQQQGYLVENRGGQVGDGVLRWDGAEEGPIS